MDDFKVGDIVECCCRPCEIEKKTRDKYNFLYKITKVNPLLVVYRFYRKGSPMEVEIEVEKAMGKAALHKLDKLEIQFYRIKYGI